MFDTHYSKILIFGPKNSILTTFFDFLKSNFGFWPFFRFWSIFSWIFGQKMVVWTSVRIGRKKSFYYFINADTNTIHKKVKKYLIAKKGIFILGRLGTLGICTCISSQLLLQRKKDLKSNPMYWKVLITKKKVWNFSNYKREQRLKKNFENLRILKI